MSVTVNGQQCTTATLTLPRSGAWFVDCNMAEAVALDARVAVVFGDLTLSGTVFRRTTFAGNSSARIVGGGGKWGKRVPAKGYQSPAGLALAPILTDAAREAGEALGAPPSVSVGTWYGRKEGQASQVLALLPVGTSWWVDDAGVTQFGTRTPGAITAPFDLISVRGVSGMGVIAADELSPFRPGKTLSHPALEGDKVIDLVVWTSRETELRGEVWWS